MKKFYIYGSVIVVLIIILSVMIVKFSDYEKKPGINQNRNQISQVNPENALRDFLRNNLSSLSPEKEVLGGKFYVTKLNVLSPSNAEVFYEDGHNAYKATFGYSLTDGIVTLADFKLTSGEGQNPTPSSSGKVAVKADDEVKTFTYQPMQCEDEPWQKWYATGKVKFIKAPTDAELITTYYGQEYKIHIISAVKKESNAITCDACGSCPKNYSFEARVTGSDFQKIQSLGWK